MSGTVSGAVAPSAEAPSVGGDAHWPSRAELRALTEHMPTARPTRYGSVNVHTRVTERSTAATFVVGDGPQPASRTIGRAAAGARLLQLERLCARFLDRYQTMAPVSRTRVAQWETLVLLDELVETWTKAQSAKVAPAMLLLERQLEVSGLSG